MYVPQIFNYSVNCLSRLSFRRKMATLLSLRSQRNPHRQQSGGIYTWRSGIGWKRGQRILRNTLGVLATAGVTCGALLYILDRSVQAMGHVAHPPSYPWDFNGYLTSLDHSAVRRGWQVYRSVCCTCHSLRYLRFMDLIDVSHTVDEVKAIAAEYEVDGRPELIACRISRFSRSRLSAAVGVSPPPSLAALA